MNTNDKSRVSRRCFLRGAGLAASAISAAGVCGLGNASASPLLPEFDEPQQSALVPPQVPATAAKGIEIAPGQWHPRYPWEQIAWISPPWPSEDYMWLDFPEAIFIKRDLIFLSHWDPAMPAVFPKVPWSILPKGVAFDRQLPNGVRFGGAVVKGSENTVDLDLHLYNGTSQPLTEITLQTCGYLRGIQEFSDLTRDNKFVFLANEGWIPLSRALTMTARPSAAYRVGWRTKGKLMADLPVLATVSNQAERLVAMTWYKDTCSMIGNPHHPCMHADPQFKDLHSGESASIHGKLIFFEGKLADFDYLKY